MQSEEAEQYPNFRGQIAYYSVFYTAKRQIFKKIQAHFNLPWFGNNFGLNLFSHIIWDYLFLTVFQLILVLTNMEVTSAKKILQIVSLNVMTQSSLQFKWRLFYEKSLLLKHTFRFGCLELEWKVFQSINHPKFNILTEHSDWLNVLQRHLLQKIVK